MILYFSYYLYTNQENILYQPNIYKQHKRPENNPKGFKHPGEYNMNYQDIYFNSLDSTRLHAWYITHNNPKKKL